MGAPNTGEEYHYEGNYMYCVFTRKRCACAVRLCAPVRSAASAAWERCACAVRLRARVLSAASAAWEKAERR